jgi:serine/threonine protein phosphatase PrpC
MGAFVRSSDLHARHAHPRHQFKSIALTHPGLVRQSNEDRVLDRQEAGLWAVADGMGGHPQGDLASTLIVEALGGLAAGGSPYAYLRNVQEALQSVNRALITRAAATPSARVIGSTVVVLLIIEGYYACLWAGDSRAYRWRAGELQQLTRDHSLVQALVDAGSLRQQEARTHRQAHVITRALGESEHLVLDMRNGPVLIGDRFLLCSDGLTNLVANDEIEGKLREGDPVIAANQLMALAMQRGGGDNVSVVVVDVA